MAGKIVADTLEHSTAGSVTTDYVVNGSIKAWADIIATQDSTPDSFNVSSIDDDATGIATLHYTSNMNNSDFSANGTCASGGSTNRGCVVSSKSTSEVQCKVGLTSSDSPQDYHQDWQVIGDLA